MPVRHVTVSTATGVFGPVDFGDAYKSVSYAALNASTAHTVVGTVQGAFGGSNWFTVLTLTTGNSTGIVNATATGPLFDKLRLNLSANNSTAAMPVWLAASV
jgi:hypothetical protein